MNFPVFIFHELIVRLSELNPMIGKYVSSEQEGDVFILATHNGTLIIPMPFIQLQYEKPSAINRLELSILANNFKKY